MTLKGVYKLFRMSWNGHGYDCEGIFTSLTAAQNYALEMWIIPNDCYGTWIETEPDSMGNTKVWYRPRYHYYIAFQAFKDLKLD